VLRTKRRWAASSSIIRHAVLHEMLRQSIVQNLLRMAGDVDVHVAANRDSQDY
jgi:hypothetical protein